MKGKGLMQKIMLIALVFFISYVFNIYLVFSNQPQMWGEYTGLIVTAIAFVLAFIILFIGREHK